MKEIWEELNELEIELIEKGVDEMVTTRIGKKADEALLKLQEKKRKEREQRWLSF